MFVRSLFLLFSLPFVSGCWVTKGEFRKPANRVKGLQTEVAYGRLQISQLSYEVSQGGEELTLAEAEAKEKVVILGREVFHFVNDIGKERGEDVALFRCEFKRRDGLRSRSLGDFLSEHFRASFNAEGEAHRSDMVLYDEDLVVRKLGIAEWSQPLVPEGLTLDVLENAGFVSTNVFVTIAEFNRHEGHIRVTVDVVELADSPRSLKSFSRQLGLVRGMDALYETP